MEIAPTCDATSMQRDPGRPEIKKGCLQYGQRDYFLNYSEGITRMNTTIEKIKIKDVNEYLNRYSNIRMGIRIKLKMFISRMNGSHTFKLFSSTQLY